MISRITIDKQYAANNTDMRELTTSVTQNGNTATVHTNYVTGLSTVTSAENRVVTQQVDPLTGLLDSAEVTGLSPVSFDYDNRGRIKTVTAGDRITTYIYEAAGKGKVTSIVNAENQTTAFAYDDLGRVNQITYHDNSVLNQKFDANGNLEWLQPPGQPKHYFNYNSVNNADKYTPPVVDGITEPQTVYQYDKDRKLNKIIRPDLQELTFNYQPNNSRLDNLVIPRGTYTYGYNALGQVNSITAPDDGVLTLGYLGDLPASQTWSGDITGSVSQQYNNHLLVKAQCVNTTDCFNYFYDKDNLLTNAGDLIIGHELQKGGLISGTTLGKLTTDREYTTFGELWTNSASYDSNSLYDVTYTHDKLGRITNKSEIILGVTTNIEYQYDNAGRLDKVIQGGETIDYDYDDNGNRTFKKVDNVIVESGSYDEQDRLTGYAGYTYQYSKNGELESKTHTDTSKTTSYQYDVLGNLMQVVIPGDSSNTTIDYIIDASDRRIGKKVNGTLVQGYLYADQLNPIAELDSNNNVISRFVYGSKINVPDYFIKGTKTYRIISNHLGSPLLVVDIANGDVVQQMDYDEFGNVTLDTNPGFQPFGFAGGIYDRDTGLTRFGARDYDPQAGRWTSKDPIRFAGGDSNIYGYVFSDPINLIDPNGLCSCPSASELVINALLLSLYMNELWSYDAIRGEFPAKSNKCNLFIHELINMSGGTLPSPNGYFNDNPLVAGQWADKNYQIEGWTPVTGPPKPGDIIAEASTGFSDATGHVAVVTGERESTSASYYGVITNDYGFRSGQNPTIRRCSC
ncbi:RHS repeat-associated core domain-containing protein [Aliikangiella maris]|uniref:RHS repeat-associated core domain-containing protein n=1 Tax=Aliikangiella maris TaxID=3162458 RepID=A0ABV3MQT1_9GAMM